MTVPRLGRGADKSMLADINVGGQVYDCGQTMLAKFQRWLCLVMMNGCCSSRSSSPIVVVAMISTGTTSDVATVDCGISGRRSDFPLDHGVVVG